MTKHKAYYANTKLVLRCYSGLQQANGRPIITKQIYYSNKPAYIRNAMKCLINLGLVEKVNLKYYLGVKHSARRDAIGYRLIGVGK